MILYFAQSERTLYMNKTSINNPCPTNGQQKSQLQPDWLTTVEILKDQAKISFFYAIKMSEAEILMDNLFDPDATIEHNIYLGIGGVKELVTELTKLGMPAHCIENVNAYRYVNITKGDIVEHLSSRAKNKRTGKLLIRELRKKFASPSGNPAMVMQETANSEAS